MKKMESLKSDKFNSFESKRIKSLAKIFGGTVPSGGDRNGYCDTYNNTPRNITNSQGQTIGTVQDQDNVIWYRCVNDSTFAMV